MPNYYVTHPSIGITASVEAPTTEKARTTFLDYLERTGKVSRSSRQFLRRNMIAEKLHDAGEVFTDVELDYDYIVPEQTFQMEPERLYEDERPEEEEMLEIIQPEETSRPIQSMSPIQRLALTGRV